MTRNRIEKIIIAGGGVAGWLTAAAISDALRGQSVEITVIGDNKPGEGRVEASLPITQAFNQRLGISEQTLMRETAGSFSLGTRFTDWIAPGHGYFLPLAAHGASIEYVHFHNFAIKARMAGDATAFNDYSLCAAAAGLGKFAHPVMERESILSTLVHTHQFDGFRYAEFHRRYAGANNVRALPENIVSAQLRSQGGFIDSVTLDNGQTLSADLYIDCSGDQAILAGGTLQDGFEDWSQWLPANRMLGATGPAGEMLPCAQITGLESGWYQALSTQRNREHRLIYCDRHLDAESAKNMLMQAVDGALNDGFETTRFQQGCRESFWTGNCIALGTAAGNVEPLAGTHLASIQAGLMRLLSMFPDKDCSPLLADEYNQLTQQEYRNIRDFLILQYRASQRATSPFWAGYLASPVPSSLEHKIELFNAHGQVAMYEEESFPDTSWASTWLGQDLWPQAYDPILDNYDFQRLQGRFEQMRQIIQQATNAMPSHRDYLGQYCPAVD